LLALFGADIVASCDCAMDRLDDAVTASSAPRITAPHTTWIFIVASQALPGA